MTTQALHSPGAQRLRLWLDLIRWDRPAGWLLLLWPTLGGLWVAAGGFPGWHLLLVFVAGTILMRSAGCCVNDVADRDFDRHVKRTAQRPVTTGAVGVKEALLLGNLFWVIAYDTEYAMVDRDDDLKVGIKTSAITLGRFDVAGVMAFYALFLASWSALGHALGMGRWYQAGIAVGAAQALWHWTLIRDRSREGCFKAFRLNHWLGAAVFAGTVVDLALR